MGQPWAASRISEATGLQNRLRPSLRPGSFLTRNAPKHTEFKLSIASSAWETPRHSPRGLPRQTHAFWSEMGNAKKTADGVKQMLSLERTRLY